MSLEDQLSSLTTPPPAADPLGRVLARAKRDRRRRTWVAVGAVTAAVVALPLVLTSATTEHRSVPAATVTVPWALRPVGSPQPGSFPQPPKTDPLPSCQFGDLTVGKAVAAPPNRLGVEVPVTVTNVGPDCDLKPDAGKVVVLDESGTVEATGTTVSSWGDRWYSQITMAHGERARARLSWSSNCGTEAGRWRVRITYGNATLDGQVEEGSAVPSCDDRTHQTYYGLRDLVVVNQYDQPRDDPQGALLSRYTADSTVAIGDVLHVALTLENPTRGDISLTPCPSFVFSFATSGRGSAFSASPSWYLNCPQAPDAIAPGQEVVFQLELPVTPALADGGLHPGTWYVSLQVGATDQDPLPVTVTAATPTTPRPTVDCGFPRTPGSGERWTAPPATVTRADVPATGRIETDKGPLTVAFDEDSPCAVTALLDLGRQGFWKDRELSEISDDRFPSLTWRTGGEYANGYLLPPEVQPGTRYPAGTVLLYQNEGGYTSFSSLQIAWDDLPYPPEFTPIGRVTTGMDLVTAAAGAGPHGAKDLTITGIRAGT